MTDYCRHACEYAVRPMTPLLMQTLRDRGMLSLIHLEYDGVDQFTYNQEATPRATLTRMY